MSSKLGESILPQLNEVVNYQLQNNVDEQEQEHEQQMQSMQNMESEQYYASSRVKTPHEFLPEQQHPHSNQVQQTAMHTPTQQQLQNAYLEAHIGSMGEVVQTGMHHMWDTAWKKSDEKYSNVKVGNNLDMSSHFQEFQSMAPQPIITETASPIKRIISGHQNSNLFNQQMQQVSGYQSQQNLPEAAQFGQNGFEMQESMIQHNPLLTLSANEAAAGTQSQSKNAAISNQQLRNNTIQGGQEHSNNGCYEDVNNGHESDKNQQRKSGALKVSQLVGGGQQYSSQMKGGDDFHLEDPNRLSLNRNPNLVAALQKGKSRRQTPLASSPPSHSSSSPSPTKQAKRARRSKTKENSDLKSKQYLQQSRQYSLPARTPLVNVQNQRVMVDSRNGNSSVKPNQTTGDSSYHLEDYLHTNKSFQNQSQANNVCSKSVNANVSLLISHKQEEQNTAKTTQSRKRETIDNFKSKLSRLEQNRADLEQRMRIFDLRVKAHQVVSSSQPQLLQSSCDNKQTHIQEQTLEASEQEV